jgi:hypothetical protein
MKTGAVFGLALSALGLLCGLIAPALAQKKIALVIGNDRYQNIPSLQKAVGDARTMSEALKSLGFTVMFAQDVSRKAFSQQLLAFDAMVGRGDVAFFFFAGHGFEIDKQNYLLPTDVPPAREGQEELLRDAAVAADRIIDRLQARGARTTIMVLDACRDNPFEKRGTRSIRGAGGLAAMTPPEGVFVVYSAGAKQTALDRLSDRDTEPNSVFTRLFVRELKEPGLTLVQIAKRTQQNVKQLAATVSHVQTPGYYDQIVGDMVLNGTAADVKVAAPQPQVALLPITPPPLVPAAEPANAPIANFMRHNTGWSITLSFADPVAAISWRLGETGNFRETGFLDTLDPRTRKRMPNHSLQLDADAPAGTLYIRAVDVNGIALGPYPIRFEPAAALEREQRKLLEMTSSGWLAFREFNGLLVYYTHLVTYRCGIREVRIGIDSTVPDRKIALPPCDPRDPSSIPHKADVHMKIPPGTKLMSVELTYRDGTISEVKTFRR